MAVFLIVLTGAAVAWVGLRLLQQTEQRDMAAQAIPLEDQSRQEQRSKRG